MVKVPRYETYCLETGVKTLVTVTGQQLPPSIVLFVIYQRQCVKNVLKILKMHCDRIVFLHYLFKKNVV